MRKSFSQNDKENNLYFGFLNDINTVLKKVFLALQLLFSCLLIAQNTNPNQRLNFSATYLKEDPNIDGNILQESLWKNIPVISNLEQIKPNYGAPVSEKT